MMLLSLFLSLIPLSAAADKVAGHAEISGRVDVPLYGGLDDMDPFFYVEVTVGEKKGLLVVATGHDEVRLTAEGAGTFGVKLKGDKPVKIAEMTIGAVKLTDVVVVERTKSSMDIPRRALPLLGEIGLAGFPELAFALLPSAGVLRLAPAAEGAALVAEIGAPMEFGYAKEEKHKIGTEKIEIDDGYSVEITISGQKVNAALATERSISRLMREVSEPPLMWMKDRTIPQISLPLAPTRLSGDVPVERRTISAGNISIDLSLWRNGVGTMALYAVPAVLGQSFLRGVDLAIDTATGKVSMHEAAAVKLASWAETAEAELKKKLEPEPVPEGGEAPSAEDQKKARLGALGGVAGWYDNMGWYDKAVPMWEELSNGKPEICTNWLNYGESLVRVGKGADGAAAAKKAAELYDIWAAQPLSERTDISEKYGKAKDKDAWEGQIPQDHACHTAWSTISAGLLLSGDYAGAAAVYPAHRDLDEMLAVVAGNALLLQGKKEEAQAAYLQSFTIDRTITAEARVGMVLTARTLEQALNQLPAAKGWMIVNDPGMLRSYLQSIRQLGGEGAVAGEVSRLLAQDPANPLLLTAEAQALTAAGKTAEAGAALQKAGARFDRLLKLYPGSAMLHAAYAEYLLAKGDSAAAREAATLATTLDGKLASGWLLLADIEAAAGDTEKAEAARRRAGALAVENPAYAMLLKKG